MPSSGLPSLSRKLLLTFIKSFMAPLILIGIFISYLFGSYQYRSLNAQSQNDTQLIRAYLSTYISDIDDIMDGLFYAPYLQSSTDLSSMSVFDKNKLSEEIGDTLSLTTYSRDDFGDLLFLSDGEVLYFNAENYYQYLPNTQSLESRKRLFLSFRQLFYLPEVKESVQSRPGKRYYGQSEHRFPGHLIFCPRHYCSQHHFFNR